MQTFLLCLWNKIKQKKWKIQTR